MDPQIDKKVAKTLLSKAFLAHFGTEKSHFIYIVYCRMLRIETLGLKISTAVRFHCTYNKPRPQHIIQYSQHAQ